LLRIGNANIVEVSMLFESTWIENSAETQEEDIMGSRLIVTVILIALIISAPAMAEEVGRYQGISVGEKLYVLDTKEGHIWTCGENPDQEVLTEFIVYHGRIQPAEGTSETAGGAAEQSGSGVIKIIDRRGETIRIIDRKTIESSEEKRSSTDD
jgi:hypothetical protein